MSDAEKFDREIAAVTMRRASRWEFLLAQLFGRKIVSEDSECVVTLRSYRGKLYMTACKIV